MSQISSVHVATEQLHILKRATTAVLFDRPMPVRSDLHPTVSNAPRSLLAILFLTGASDPGPERFSLVCDKATTVHKVPIQVKKMSKRL